MFGRVPGTRPNISASHSAMSTRVPFCIEEGPSQAKRAAFDVICSDRELMLGALRSQGIAGGP